MKGALPNIDIFQFREGDSSCYKLVFDFYSPIIYRYIQSKCAIVEDVEELLQETFVQLFLAKEKISTVEDFYPLLFTIAKRLTITYFRKQVSLRNTHLKAQQYWTYSSDSTEELMQYSELNRLLDAIIESLPPQQRQVYILSQKDNKTTDDIADEMSLSKNTVKNHLRLATKNVRLNLQKIYQLFL